MSDRTETTTQNDPQTQSHARRAGPPTMLREPAGERMALRLESEICSRGVGVYTARIVIRNDDDYGEAVLAVGDSMPTMDEAHGSAIHRFGRALLALAKEAPGA